MRAKPPKPRLTGMTTHNGSRDDRNSWRTSTAPAAIAVSLLTALAVGLALGFYKLVEIATTMLAA